MPSPNIMEALLRMQQLPGTVMPTDYNVGQPDPMQIDPAELQRDALDARTKSQLAQALIGQGYIPNSGKAGILSQVFSTLVGAKMQRGADEKMSDVLGKNWELKQREDLAKHQRELAAEERKWQREQEGWRKKAEIEAEYRAPKEPSLEERLLGELPPELRGKAAMGKFGLLPKEREPRAPTETEMKINAYRAAGWTPQQIAQAMAGQSGARATPEDREKAKLESGRVKEAEERARAAAKTLGNVQKLEKMMGKGFWDGLGTGPLDQYIPGGDRQLFDSLAADLNLSTLRQNFGGNPTEGERAANASTLPGKGYYEDVNKKLLSKLRADAEAKLKEAQALGIDVSAFVPQDEAGGNGWSVTRIK